MAEDAPSDAEAFQRIAEHIIGAFQVMASNAHVHMWDILGVKLPASPIHPRMPASSTTTVLLKCRGCQWPATTELDGIWTKEQVRKASE
jgi:hypothetical protein